MNEATLDDFQRTGSFLQHPAGKSLPTSKSNGNMLHHHTCDDSPRNTNKDQLQLYLVNRQAKKNLSARDLLGIENADSRQQQEEHNCHFLDVDDDGFKSVASSQNEEASWLQKSLFSLHNQMNAGKNRFYELSFNDS